MARAICCSSLNVRMMTARSGMSLALRMQPKLSLTDLARRIADVHRPRGEIAKRNPTCTKHGALSYRHTGSDKPFRSDPRIRFDGDGACDQLKVLIVDVMRAGAQVRAL